MPRTLDVAATPADPWIAQATPGRRFADVGGLWGTVNEKATVALAAGAAEATMIDITPRSNVLWRAFRERCAERGGGRVRCLQANIADPARVSRLGRWDVVHCSGVLYHCANPWSVMQGLSQICADVLVLGSAVLPSRIEAPVGSLELAPGSALFVPAMSKLQRKVVSHYFKEAGALSMLGVDTDSGWQLGSFDVWWWLFSAEFIESLLEVSGFKVIARGTDWLGRTALFMAQRKKRLPSTS